MIGIYLITSPSNRKYIGQTWNFKKRMKDYRNMPEGKQHILYNSFQKYGFENHSMEMVHELPEDVGQDVMDRYEQFYLDTYRDAGFKMMNCRDAGSRGKFTDEGRKRLSETKQGMGKGRKQSEEWITKRTECQKGNKHFLGRKHSEETRKKQSDAAKIIANSQEHILRSINNLKGVDNRKPIVQLSKDDEFIKEWDSAKSAEVSGMALARSICAVCKGQYKTANGFKWLYKSDYEAINN